MALHLIARAKASLLEALSELLAFARRPRLPEHPPCHGSKGMATGLWLLLMSFAVTAAFAALTVPLMLLTAAGPSDALRQTFSQPILMVVIAVVIVGPLIEEIIFRGWLAGTWRSVAASGLCLAIFYGGVAMMTDLAIAPPWARILGPAMVGIAVFWLMRPIDSGPRVAGYSRVFPFLFWGQGVVFGLLHYQNIAATSPVSGLLTTLPLILCAWLWGYARIRLGLGGAVLLHAAYNVPAVIGLMAVMAIQSG